MSHKELDQAGLVGSRIFIPQIHDSLSDAWQGDCRRHVNLQKKDG